MNWKSSFKRKFLFILGFCLLVFLCCFLFLSILENKIESRITELIKSTTTENLRSIEPRRKYSETSPNGLREIILYERVFTGDGEYEYRSYLNNQYLFVVKEFRNGAEHEIYIGDDKVGYPHWLGNDFIFFTGGCGTGCRGFYLVDTRSKESFQGVITTTPVSENGFATHLHDWFDHEFKFVGFDKNIRSVYLDNKTYLIFEMWNNNQYIGEKKFLFTGDSLKER